MNHFMRHINYYNQYNHKLLSQYYFFRKSERVSFRKYPALKQNRHTRLFLKKKINLRRFVYNNVTYKTDKRRL